MTIDENGDTLGAWYDPSTWGDAAPGDWQPSPKYPDMDFIVVPNGTATTPDLAAWVIDSPQPGQTTFYKIAPRAYAAGRAEAAMQTIQGAGEQLIHIGENALTTVGTIASNIIPILLGIAALFLLYQSDKSK